jgi:hypothetical protein
VSAELADVVPQAGSAATATISGRRLRRIPRPYADGITTPQCATMRA